MSSYAQLTDLYNVAPAAMFGAVPVPQQQACLDAWSDQSDRILGSRARVPWITPPPALVRLVAILGGWDIINFRGFDPTAGSDVNFRIRAIGGPGFEKTNALYELHALGRGEGQLVGGVEGAIAQPQPVYPAPIVASRPRQGWLPTSGRSGIF